MKTYTEQEYNDLHDQYLQYFKRAYELQVENHELRKHILHLNPTWEFEPMPNARVFPKGEATNRYLADFEIVLNPNVPDCHGKYPDTKKGDTVPDSAEPYVRPEITKTDLLLKDVYDHIEELLKAFRGPKGWSDGLYPSQYVALNDMKKYLNSKTKPDAKLP